MNKKWELVNFCEFDKYAVKSYCAIHNIDESLNLGDITKVDEKKIADFDMMTWGFPCTDISIAGKQEGFINADGEKTRSGLYYDGLRILKWKKPKISIIENVKALTNKKFKGIFEMILNDLDKAGYNSYWQICNAKDFGVPQNRERCFVISIRKDVDNGKFKFPEVFDNGLRLKDILEDEVDSKYIVSNEKTKQFLKNVENKIDTSKECLGTCHYKNDLSKSTRDRVYNNSLNCPTLTATMYKDPPKILQIGNLINSQGKFKNPQVGRIYSENGISPTLNTCQGGQREPKILKEENKNMDENNYCIRKLTPKECWRLMGFSDEDFEKAQNAGVSSTQLYKQAGNSIVTNVLYYIFKELYNAMPYLFDDLKVGSYFSGVGAFEVGLDRLYADIINNYKYKRVKTKMNKKCNISKENKPQLLGGFGEKISANSIGRATEYMILMP